ncbi:DUF1697 domain-containing protein [Wenyingzhuangia sp. IMCC45467]
MYIVLLRGINVSGKHKIIMKDFVNILLENPKLLTVKSYIQSGNFIVESSLQKTKEISDLFSEIILNKYEYNVKAFVYTLNDFKNICDYYPYPIDYKTNYLTFLTENPETSKTVALKNKDFYIDEFKIDDNKVIYIKYATKYSDSKLNNNYFEKQLGVLATTRNIKTVGKLIEMTNK